MPEFSRPWPKMRSFQGQNRGGAGAILTPSELVLTFVGFYLYANFGVNRSINATVTDGRTEFLNLSHDIT